MSDSRSLLVTGSSGLIGSEVCAYFADRGYTIHGIDNNQRAVFFGPDGDTRWNQNGSKRPRRRSVTTSWTFATGPFQPGVIITGNAANDVVRSMADQAAEPLTSSSQPVS